MSQLVDGIRVITEGPPPIRDVTDAPAIPARFTPPPARERLELRTAPEPPTAPAAAPEPTPDPVADQPEPQDTFFEGSLDPEWATRQPGFDEEEDELVAPASGVVLRASLGVGLLALGMALLLGAALTFG